MHHLLQPRVLTSATIAAAASALVCYPGATLIVPRPEAIWFLEATLFVCTIVLWSFVFAWRIPYTGRPVFIFRQEPKLFWGATVIALAMAAMFYWLIDPPLRTKFPKEYPEDVLHWLALVLFSSGLNELFLVFAPCDLVMRLSKRPWVAVAFTAMFAVFVQMEKIQTLTTPVPPWLMLGLLTLRFAGGALAAWLYLRGGAVLVWWWAFILSCRHLPQLIH